MTTESTEPAFPGPPTDAERKDGLGASRLADLQRLADALKAKKRGRPAKKVVAATAEGLEVTVSTFRRRFGELARLAGWKSTTPEDYLAGKPTTQGGHRHGAVLDGEDTTIGGRVKISTKDLVSKARRQSGLSYEAYMKGAAEHILAGGRFLTLDSQSE